MFYAFVLVCGIAASDCSLMSNEKQYAQRHLCDSDLREVVHKISTTPEFDKAMADKNTFVAECVNIRDGRDLYDASEYIIRYMLRRRDPTALEQDS